MAAIVDMDDNILKIYIPKIGDRLAVIRYCKANRPSKTSDRSSLVERIRKSQFGEEYTGRGKNLSSEVQVKEKKKAPNERMSRIINIGWIMDGVAVREINGGGTRSVSIEKSAKKKDILEKALNLFFPNGVSAKKYGPLAKYNYELLDYKQLDFDNNFTVGELYKMTGLTTLRFYLSTTRISEDNSLSDTENRKKCRKSIKKRKKHQKEFNEEDTPININNIAVTREEFGNENNIEESKENIEISFTVGSSFEDCYIPNALDSERNNLNEFLIFDDFNFTQNGTTSENNPESLSSSKTLIVHRGQIFTEMTEAFLAIQRMNTFIEIEIIGTNGVKENAFDGGGVFRDALTEYWNEFYDRLCLGSTTKIPEVNYLIDNNKWKSIAKILLIGYRQANYFPIKLSKPFIEFAIFGKTFADLTEAYMKYIPPLDADIISKAIMNFDSVDPSEMLDALTNIECKQIVNEENVTNVIQQLAHTEIIQKSLYILQTWGSVLKNAFSINTLNEIYNKSEVTHKAVLQLIQNFVSEDLDPRRERVYGFLKRFIREADIDILSRFLRFCTGADIVTCDSITIELSNQTVPSSHTCNNILLLPIHYDSYRSFKSEFTNILKSNMWCMDIV